MACRRSSVVDCLYHDAGRSHGRINLSSASRSASCRLELTVLKQTGYMESNEPSELCLRGWAVMRMLAMSASLERPDDLRRFQEHIRFAGVTLYIIDHAR